MQQLSITTTEYKSCAITGHRDLPKNLSREKLKADLRALIQEGVQYFYNGLAVGFDLLTAEILVELKVEFSNLHICGCIPFHGQEQSLEIDLPPTGCVIYQLSPPTSGRRSKKKP